MADYNEEQKIRIKAITKLYYSNPKILDALVKFSANREVVPRYFDGFGKRPDAVQYPSDILGLVSKGATSFHCSEELWNDPLQINSDMNQEEMGKMRKTWDLLIDIDSPYLDLSKLAAKLVIKALEFHGIYNYGIKFSGSKGFHIIVSGKAFPKTFQNQEMKDMFPEWPRAITEYLFDWIKPAFMKEAGKIMTLGVSEETAMHCTNCGRIAQKGIVTRLKCPVCSMEAERKISSGKRKLRCMNGNCPGILETQQERDYFYCDLCKDPENQKSQLDSEKNPEDFKEMRGEKVSEHAKFDLVLVAPRHLFRMPYSLHEKTSLSSIVLKKEQIENFTPRDANPMSAKIIEYLPENEEGEARNLLASALEWKKGQDIIKEKVDEKYSKSYSKDRVYENIEIKDVKEGDFPAPIKKLLLGLKDGKKRGLFILLTFLKSLNFDPEFIINRIKEWNKVNQPPLKEGYVKSQIDWHLKQKKKILPPNYDNEAFYKDLGLLDKKPEVKNPIVEVIRKIKATK